MRLLNIDTLAFEEFNKRETVPPYIVTSHRWTDHEVTYKDVLKRRDRTKRRKGYQKILGFCEVARRARKHRTLEGETLDGGEAFLDWIWVDTCCIDKTSSAEVSESINSMCTWYEDADFCLAYLADVDSAVLGPDWWDSVGRSFRRSEWFRRGWTLQELLAPRCVIFLAADWRILGHKCSYGHIHDPRIARGSILNSQISQITGIPERVLSNFYVRHDITFENRMLWTAGRETTKAEDQAYCLLGVFNIYMPLLYGEGAHRAMERLKEEFTKRHATSTPSRVSTLEEDPLANCPAQEKQKQGRREAHEPSQQPPTERHVVQYTWKGMLMWLVLVLGGLSLLVVQYFFPEGGPTYMYLDIVTVITVFLVAYVPL